MNKARKKRFFLLPILFISILTLLFFTNGTVSARMGPGPAGGGGGGGGMSGTTLTIFETADFSGSGICAFCHSSLMDSAGNDVSIDAHWRSTMMANSGKDPLWQAKISSEVNRNPALQSVIKEKCSRCHMGMARYQAMTDGTTVGVLGSGFLDPGHYLHEAAMDGVSCTLCHQIQDINLGMPESFTGQYVIDTSSSPPDRLAFGPYDQPVKHPMEMHSGFSPLWGIQITDSALCGTCHTLYTPSVDAGGNVIGEFPEQTTYLEWEHSVMGGGLSFTCQDCHLPDAVGSVVISNRPHWLLPRSPFGQHHLVGGNSFMVNLLKTNASAIGATADSDHFDATIARTNAQLQNETASVNVVSASINQDVLAVVFNIQNKAGHKIPSGIPARRVWLHVTVKDARGQLVFESGRPQSDVSITGNDADLNPLSYEPHYDVITSANQVQIYEPIMLDSDGAVTYTLLRAASYAKDNRLLPAGFDKAIAPPDIAVWGSALTDDDFVAGSDQVTYLVNVYGKRRPLTVTAELLYQPVSYTFAENLRQDGTDLVNRFFGFFDPADKTPKVIDTVQQAVR
ncbi:MAG: hypothetical protein AB1390_01250 [Nitrospirota bacterium]